MDAVFHNKIDDSNGRKEIQFPNQYQKCLTTFSVLPN